MRIARNRTGAMLGALSLVVGVIVLVVPPALAGVVINVPASQPTIQAGIDAAANGDTVVVASGYYYENIDFKGKAITVRSLNAREAWNTWIDGGGKAPVVVFKSGESREAQLTGFIITNGFLPPGAGVDAGAGIAIKNASPTIVWNIVTGNNAGGHAGGGIGAVGGAALIAENEMSQNTAAGTGGGAFVHGDIELSSNSIRDNTAGGGAGLAVNGGAVDVHHNAIVANRATANSGGGLSSADAGGRYVNNYIARNTAATSGGGVYLADGTGGVTSYLLNNTIINNEATTGPGLRIESSGPRLTNNVVTGPPGQAAISCAGAVPPTFSHNDVYAGGSSPYGGCPDPTGSAGNISADPLIEPDHGNPRIDSPIVDAGDNAAPHLPATIHVPYGRPRVADGDGDGLAVVDIGNWESPQVPFTGTGYHPLTPARILDTRTGDGAPAGKVGPDGLVSLQVTGRGGVPSERVRAVVLNVTVTEPTAPSFLTAWPAGASRPLASNLNYATGQTVANLVTVMVGAGGKVDLLNSAGATHVVVDVAGWYGTSAGDRLTSLSPARILDSRAGAGPRPAGTTTSLQVTGQGGIPASGVSAVVLNLTATNTGSEGWLAAWPAGEARPVVSNVNYIAGQTAANLVIVKVGAGGAVNLYSSGGPVDIVADVAGYYGDTGAGFAPLTPARILDTRTAGGPVAPGTAVSLQVTGAGGVPAFGVAAVVLNVTVTEPASGGWLAAWPAGEALPLVSNLNYVAGQTVPNLVVVKVGAGGMVNLYSSGGPVHVVADVAGWFVS